MCLGFGFKHILLILLKSCVSAVLSNLESRVCVVSKLTLCPGQGEPSSGVGSSFLCCCSVFILWAPKVLFYRT